MLFLKNLFNRIFGEERKNKIREKLAPLFLKIDKLIFYKEYSKAVKYILKKCIYEEYEGYSYRYQSFLNKVKLEYIRLHVLDEYADTKDSEIKKCIDFIKKHGVEVFCDEMMHKQIYTMESIQFDKTHGLFYGIYNGKKLYFRKSVNTEQKALEMLNGLAAEQQKGSPHRYLTEKFNVEAGDVIFDIGSAEGNFALDAAERAKAIYLFEAEPDWGEALALTFEPYKEKTVIIPKYVSDKDDEMSVRLDSFCRENHIEQIDFIKMDVEGYEGQVLSGASDMLQEKKVKKLAVTTYHRLEDEKNIGNILSDYHKEMSDGYMLGSVIYDIWNIKPPYFVKGVMRASK